MEGDPEYDEMTDEKIEFLNKINIFIQIYPNNILKAGVKDFRSH